MSDNAEFIAAARAAMDGFMAAFNAEDAEAIRTKWFHFPHVRFHSGNVTITERPEDYTTNLVWTAPASPRNGAAQPGTMSKSSMPAPTRCISGCSSHDIGPTEPWWATYRSLYIVTLKDGRWAIQGRSSWSA